MFPNSSFLRQLSDLISSSQYCYIIVWTNRSPHPNKREIYPEFCNQNNNKEENLISAYCGYVVYFNVSINTWGFIAQLEIQALEPGYLGSIFDFATDQVCNFGLVT